MTEGNRNPIKERLRRALCVQAEAFHDLERDVEAPGGSRQQGAASRRHHRSPVVHDDWQRFLGERDVSFAGALN